MSVNARSAGLPLSLALVVICCLGGPGTAGASVAPCRPKGSTTILATPKVRVYQLTAKRTARFYACLVKPTRAFSLGPAAGGTLYPVVIRGPFIAYQRFFVTRGAVDTDLAVRDLRTGRVVHAWCARSC